MNSRKKISSLRSESKKAPRKGKGERESEKYQSEQWKEVVKGELE